MKRNKGFLLAELVIALAIIAIGITFILQAISFCAQVTALSADITRAIFILEDEISKSELQNKFSLSANQANGANDKFAISYKKEEIEQSSLLKIDYMTDWKRIGRKNDLTLSLFIKNVQK